MTLADEIKALQDEEPYMYVDEVIEILEHPIVKERSVSGTTRWGVINEMVVDYHGTFYMVDWETPATEMQEGGDYQESWTLTEVEPVERVVIDYERVRKG